MDLIGDIELSEWACLVNFHVVGDEFDIHGVQGSSVPADPVCDVLVDVVCCSECFSFCDAGIGRCVSEMKEAVGDILIVCNCTWPQAFVGIRK